jgi:hypothetical protein
MSLHELAHHVQKAGRGEDTVLIHMTPKEVNGLQSLAMAHGGSLTINPKTGLAEAGFLSSILPMIAGVGLTIASGGALSPLMAAGLVGGGTALATGSLQKGLMAGLGAYGGAGLGAGLSSVGAAATPASVAPAMTAAPNAGASLFGNSTIGAGISGAQANNALSSAMSVAPGTAAPITASGVLGTSTAPTLANMGTGLGTLNSTAGFSNLYTALPKYTLPALGATALGAMQQKYDPPKQDQGMIRPYEFSRTQNQEAYDQGNPIYAEDPGSSRERNFFTDQFTALTPYKAPGPEYKAAGGGLTSLAVGGAVEEMSAQNALGDNQMYPQSQLQTPMYSNPMVQRPVPSNVITSGVDAPVAPYTGEAKFAKGGKTTGEYKYDYNPQTQEFTQTAAPKPVPAGFLSPLMAEISARTNVYGGGSGGVQDRAAGSPKTSAPAAPIVTGGIAPAPQAQQQPIYQQPQAAPIPAYQSPEQQLGLEDFYDYMNQQLGQMRQGQMQQGYAGGGSAGGYNLGDYSDGGRLLRGPGDGVSDSIPASIGSKQPARLADGEFVVPARIVSELGNGSTEAGARKLYAMMDRVQRARKKSIGKGKVAVNSRTEKLLPV